MAGRKKAMLSEREAQLLEEFRVLEKANGTGQTSVLMFYAAQEQTATTIEGLMHSALDAESKSYPGQVFGLVVKIADDANRRGGQYDWMRHALDKAFNVGETTRIFQPMEKEILLQ